MLGESTFRWLLGGGTIPDEQAMWRVKMTADADAFAQLMSRWRGPIHRLCTRMLGDEHRAEDLTQEAFSRIFAKRADYRMEAKFSTFLWRVALNLCHDELRRVSRRRESSASSVELGLGSSPEAEENLPHPLLVEESSPDIAMAHRERAESVQAAMARLSPLYREVVILRHYESLKFREIAEVLGIPEGTVKSRMSEALTQLSRWLTPSGESISLPAVDPEKLLL